LAPQGLKVQPKVVSQVAQVHEPGLFLIGQPGDFGRVRNTGKNGYEVSVYRITGTRRELISSDSYPAMHRIVQTR
jgi:hypothetical protein